MSFRTSGLRVAGQESGFVDFIFPSAKISPSSPGSGFSPVQGKAMYRDSESIQSWIDTIYYADQSTFKLADAGADDIFEFSTHPFRAHGPYSPLSDEFDSVSSASICSDASAWIPEVAESSYDDSDDSASVSSPDEAQYITIPANSPWYRPPSPTPEPISAHTFGTGTYPDSCSSDVRQAIAQQELLLAVFYEELRRLLPGDAAGQEYDFDWLDEVDIDLVLAPTETYADLCWESVVSEKSPTLRLGKPLADVPIGFGDVHGTF